MTRERGNWYNEEAKNFTQARLWPLSFTRMPPPTQVRRRCKRKLSTRFTTTVVSLVFVLSSHASASSEGGPTSWLKDALNGQAHLLSNLAPFGGTTGASTNGSSTLSSSPSTQQQQHSQNSSRRRSRSRKQKTGTIVSGYGSTRHIEASTVSVATTVLRHPRYHGNDDDANEDNNNSNINNSVVRQTVSQKLDAPLHLIFAQDANGVERTIGGGADLPTMGKTLLVYSRQHDATIRITANDRSSSQHHNVDDNYNKNLLTLAVDDTVKDKSLPLATTTAPPLKCWGGLEAAIPVEGLYGTYSTATGTVAVWIVASRPVYGTLRRITEVHLTKLVHHSNEDSALLMQTERNQLQLLRQAFKDHEWYYCKKEDPVLLSEDDILSCKRQQQHYAQYQLRDVTRSLQSSLMAAAGAAQSSYQMKNSTKNRHALDDDAESVTTESAETVANTQSHNGTLRTETKSEQKESPIPTLYDPAPKFGWWYTATASTMAAKVIPMYIQEQTMENDDSAVGETGNDSSHTTRPTVRWWDTTVDHLRPDSRFFWNEPALELLVHFATCDDDTVETASSSAASKILLDHAIPVTSAFCGVQINKVIEVLPDAAADSKPEVIGYYDQLLISRRSRFRAGTRFTKRGADSSGHVANYAETEQLILPRYKIDGYPTRIFSHVQTRGSIPLRWSSPTDIKTYRPRIRIGTDPLAQARCMRRHLVDQAAHYVVGGDHDNTDHSSAKNCTTPQYASMLLVNLIDKHSDQGRLGRAMDAVLNAILDVYSNANVNDTEANPDSVRLDQNTVQHLWFDFHAEVKAGRWDKLLGLLKQVESCLTGQGYCVANVTGDDEMPYAMEQLQNGVVRTNCMDCLDRTNVVQSMFARYVMFQQLNETTSLSQSTQLLFRISPMALPWQDGEVSHRALWADNADSISRLYAGTPALKGDFTRTGKRTRKGALDDGMNSLQRYYLNNFLDADRQEGMDLLTGHQGFSNANDIGEDSINSETGNAVGENTAGTSLKDAARRLFLGASYSVPENDWDDVHSPDTLVGREIELPLSSNDNISTRNRQLALRWLPGDSQSLLRSLVSVDSDLFREMLREVDERAEQRQPWWAYQSADISDASVSESSLTATEVPHESGESLASHSALLFAALYVGMQAPLTVAAVVMGFIATSFPKMHSFWQD